MRRRILRTSCATGTMYRLNSKTDANAWLVGLISHDVLRDSVLLHPQQHTTTGVWGPTKPYLKSNSRKSMRVAETFTQLVEARYERTDTCEPKERQSVFPCLNEDSRDCPPAYATTIRMRYKRMNNPSKRYSRNRSATWESKS